MGYAQGTTVAAERSRLEIERLLKRYGASHFNAGWTPDGPFVLFQLQARFIRLALPMPKVSPRSSRTPSVVGLVQVSRYRFGHQRGANPPPTEQSANERGRATCQRGSEEVPPKVAGTVVITSPRAMGHLSSRRSAVIGQDDVGKELRLQREYPGGALP